MNYQLKHKDKLGEKLCAKIGHRVKEIMKDRLKLNFKLLLKTKYTIFPYAAIFVFTVGVYIFYFINSSLSGIVNTNYEIHLLQLSPFYFIIHLFTSYLYLSKAKRDNFFESLYCGKSNTGKLMISQVTVLLILTFITSVFALLSFYIFSAKSFTDSKYIYYILKLVLYYYFLADTAAALFGTLCSCTKKYSSAYIMLTVFSLATSPLIVNISNIIYEATGIYIGDATKIFMLYPRDFRYINHEFGYPSLINHMFLPLFWILLCIVIINLLQIRQLKKYIKLFFLPFISCLLAIVLLLSSLTYSEAPYIISEPKIGWDSEYHYYLPSEKEKTPIQMNEPAEFDIAYYNIKFNMLNELNAEVEIGIDNSKTDEYKFTLYRGYNVKKILNESGERLSFSQIGDYITVMPSKKIKSLRFYYSGCSALYHSNYESICLPGGFAYYPISGFHYTYDIGRQGRLNVSLDYETQFNVEIIGTKGAVYTNLEKAEKTNSFIGKSNALTIVSSYTLKEAYIDDCRIVYYEGDEELAYMTNFIRNNIDTFNGKSVICVFVYDNGVDVKKSIFSDHMTIRNSYEIDSTPYYDKSYSYPPMDVFYRFLTYYDEDSKIKQYLTQIEQNSISQEDKKVLQNDPNYLLAEKIHTYSADEVYTDIHNLCAGNYGLFNATSEIELINLIGEEENSILDKYYDKNRS